MARKVQCEPRVDHFIVCPHCGARNLRSERQCVKCDAHLPMPDPSESPATLGHTEEVSRSDRMQHALSSMRGRIDEHERLLIALKTDLGILEKELVGDMQRDVQITGASLRNRWQADVDLFNRLSCRIPQEDVDRTYALLRDAEKGIVADDFRRAETLLHGFEEEIERFLDSAN